MSTERENTMASMYGEAVTKVQAAKMLNCSRNTLTKLVHDGKIAACCEGKRVDVRSIAKYLESGQQKYRFV